MDDRRRELERVAAASGDPADQKAVRMARCRAGEHCGCLEETEDVLLLRYVTGYFYPDTTIRNDGGNASAVVVRHALGDPE